MSGDISPVNHRQGLSCVVHSRTFLKAIVARSSADPLRQADCTSETGETKHQGQKNRRKRGKKRKNKIKKKEGKSEAADVFMRSFSQQREVVSRKWLIDWYSEAPLFESGVVGTRVSAADREREAQGE